LERLFFVQAEKYNNIANVAHAGRFIGCTLLMCLSANASFC